MKNHVLGVIAGLAALALSPAAASAQTGTLSVLDANGAKQHLCEVIDGSSNLYACNTVWGITGSLPNYVTVEINHALDTDVVNFPSGFYAYQPDSLASGSIASATLNAAYTVSLANAEGVVGMNISGLTASGATLTAEAADNASTWYPINLFSTVAGSPSTTVTADGNYKLNTSGHTSVRLRVSTVGTGSIAVASVASSASSMVTEANSSTIGADLGPVGATACTTDTGSCSLNALIQRLNTLVDTYVYTQLYANNTTLGGVKTDLDTIAGFGNKVDTVVQATEIDRGGSITTGGTAQALMPSNASRRGWAVQNLSVAGGPNLYVNCLATATQDYHSLLITPGQLYESQSTHVPTGACSIIGPTSGQTFYAREF